MVAVGNKIKLRMIGFLFLTVSLSNVVPVKHKTIGIQVSFLNKVNILVSVR